MQAQGYSKHFKNFGPADIGLMMLSRRESRNKIGLKVSHRGTSHAHGSFSSVLW